jgi:hypothetical protein
LNIKSKNIFLVGQPKKQTHVSSGGQKSLKEGLCVLVSKQSNKGKGILYNAI